MLQEARPLTAKQKWDLPPFIPPLLYPVEIPLTDEDESEDGKYVSEAVYWKKYYEHPNFSYEWNNGILEAKPMPDYLNYAVYDWFIQLLDQFLYIQAIARIIGLETGFRLAMAKKTTIRKPDLGIVLNSNPIPLKDKDRSYHGVFDMCIESLSDSSKKERDRDLVIKKGEYANIGVKEYYILADDPKYTAFYRLNKAGVYEPIQPVAGVIYSQVLVGFQFRQSDLRRKPGLIELAEDSVYQSYVLPEYQIQKQRAEQERQRAEQERQHAKQERQRAEQQWQRAEQQWQRAEQEHHEKEQQWQRAERYAAKLQALGISLD